MKQTKTSREFERAMWDSLREEFADVPKEEELDLSFSPEFEQRMDSLCRSTSRKSWKYVNTTAKRVLIAAVLIIRQPSAVQTVSNTVQPQNGPMVVQAGNQIVVASSVPAFQRAG